MDKSRVRMANVITAAAKIPCLRNVTNTPENVPSLCKRTTPTETTAVAESDCTPTPNSSFTSIAEEVTDEKGGTQNTRAMANTPQATADEEAAPTSSMTLSGDSFGDKRSNSQTTNANSSNSCNSSITKVKLIFFQFLKTKYYNIFILVFETER